MTPKKFYKTILYLTIATLIIISVVTYFAWTGLSKISRSVYEKDVYYNSFKAKVFALESLNRNFNKIKNNIENIEFALPKEKNIDRLMTDLENNATKNNVKFIVYKYSDPNSKGKKKVETIKDLDLTQTVKQGNYYEIPFEISLEGKYSDVLNFLKQVENSKRLITVKNIEITKVDLGDTSPPDAVKLVSSIVIYMKR